MPVNFGLYSYGIAALAYTVLTCCLLFVWRDRRLNLSVAVAAVLTAVWGAVIAVGTLLPYPPIKLMMVVEAARNVMWICLLLSIIGARLRGTGHALAGRGWLPFFAIGVTIVSIVLFAFPYLENFVELPPEFIRDTVYCVWLALCLMALLLLEQVYRSSTQHERWSLKYLAIGLGFLFAYDFFMYADALVLRQIDITLWRARGLAVSFSALLLAIAIRRGQRRQLEVQISRHMVFHTFTLLAAGLYLVLMSVTAYFVNYLGGSFGGVLQVAYLSGAGLLLVVLLASGQMRARTRVWLSKNFFSYKYDYRREWLEFTRTLVGGGNETPRAVLQAMVQLGQGRAGLLWVRSGSGGYHLEEHWQMSLPADEDLELERYFTDWMQETEWIVDLQEWRRKPSVYGFDMPVSLAQAAGAWLVIPLMFGGRLEAVLAMRRSQPEAGFNWEDYDLLKLAGRQAASHLAQYTANQALIESQQFDAFNRLSAYVVHDLKNILAQESLILSNADNYRHDPDFMDDVIETIGDSVARMTRLMEQMREGARGGEAQIICLDELLAEVIDRFSKTAPQPELEFQAEDQWVEAERDRLATVFGHIIQNGKEAAGKHGRVVVRLSREGGNAVVVVEDDGFGMDEAFIKNRLFKPFDSTKGLTGMGVGAFESREFLRVLGGNLRVRSTPGAGSCFRIVIPSVDPEYEHGVHGNSQ